MSASESSLRSAGEAPEPYNFFHAQRYRESQALVPPVNPSARRPRQAHACVECGATIRAGTGAARCADCRMDEGKVVDVVTFMQTVDTKSRGQWER